MAQALTASEDRDSAYSQPPPGASHNLLGVALRIVSMAGKFLLILYFARFLSLEAFGLYGLVVTTVTLLTFVLGFEFHSYSTREMLGRPFRDWQQLLWSQILFHVGCSSLFLPLSLAIFWQGVLPWSIAPYFYVILLASHICQELFRFLLMTSRPLAAYAVSAASQGVWAYAAIIPALFVPGLRTLDWALGVWALSCSITAVLGLLYLRNCGLLGGPLHRPDVAWIRRGIGASLPYFGITIVFRLMEQSDRYFIQAFAGMAAVGVYTFYVNLAKVISDVIFTGFVAVTFPAYISTFAQHDMKGHRFYKRQLRIQVLGGTAVLLPFFIAGFPFLVNLMKRPELMADWPAYGWVLLSNLFLNIAILPHYWLYARRRDRQILRATLLGAVTNLALNVLLVPRLGITGAAIASASAYGVLALVKYRMATDLQKSESRSS